MFIFGYYIIILKVELIQLKNNLLKVLIPQYGVEESEQFFFMLSETYLGVSKIDVALNPKLLVNKEKHVLFSSALERLLTNEPIQYIIGSTYFYGNDFEVNRHTLIPRPETEELVDWIINDTGNKALKILDIGTGSGCIAISVAHKLPKAQLTAMDISAEALTMAKKNADKLKVCVNFEEQDVLKLTEFTNEFDIVVSNPPYVRELEKEMMSANVLDYEPDLALFVSDTNPLIFYYKIAELFLAQAKKNALLYFEINEYLGTELKEGLQKMGFTFVEIRQDFRAKERMLKASI